MIFLDHSRRATTTGAMGLRTAQSTIIPAWNEVLMCGLQDMVGVYYMPSLSVSIFGRPDM